VEALPEILERRPDVRLRIAGLGSQEQRLLALAERLGVADRVAIAPVPPEEPEAMARLLLEASIVVALSDYESQSLVVLESLALRRPTLALYAGANREHADAGRVHAVPADATPADVARAVVELLE